jgi:hypothetical protein
MGSCNQNRSRQTDRNKEDEMKKVLILAATVAAALSVGVATSAATPTTPNGYCGALNMVNSAAMAGFFNDPPTGPMAKDNPNGNAGMFTAVGNSACG